MGAGALLFPQGQQVEGGQGVVLRPAGAQEGQGEVAAVGQAEGGPGQGGPAGGSLEAELVAGGAFGDLGPGAGGGSPEGGAAPGLELLAEAGEEFHVPRRDRLGGGGLAGRRGPLGAGGATLPGGMERCFSSCSL